MLRLLKSVREQSERKKILKTIREGQDKNHTKRIFLRDLHSFRSETEVCGPPPPFFFHEIRFRKTETNDFLLALLIEN